MFRRLAILTLLTPLAFLAAGCDSAKDCVELCEEGQEGSCTSVQGDCSGFCSSLDNVQEPSSCLDQRDTYEECLNEGDSACDNNCSSSENALVNCVTAYCLANQSDSDCQSLATHF